MDRLCNGKSSCNNIPSCVEIRGSGCNSEDDCTFAPGDDCCTHGVDCCTKDLDEMDMDSSLIDLLTPGSMCCVDGTCTTVPTPPP